MKKEITFNDAKAIMDYIAYNTKKEVGITEDDFVKCEESSNKIQKFCLGKINACPMKTTAIGFSNFYHCFDIISLSDKYSFIIDLTYEQFEIDNYPIYVDGKREYIDSPAKYLSEKEKQELEDNGYIPYTKENLIKYLYSFIKPYKKKQNIDEDFVINEAIAIIKDFKIDFCDKNNFIYNCNNNIKAKK